MQVRRIGEKNGESFKGALKTKRKKHMKRLSFITQFKIELLLPFTSCRKVLEKCLHKTDSSNPTKRETYWMQIPKFIAPSGKGYISS